MRRFSGFSPGTAADGPHGYPFPELEYYFFYPHLDEDALLVIDDIHIPTIFRLFSFLREEAMFDFLGVASTTAFFRRNSSPAFHPLGDGWWLQNYNKNRFPVQAFDRDIDLLAVKPMAAAAGDTLEVVAFGSDDVVTPVSVVSRYRPEYPVTYRLRTPVHLARGSHVDIRSSSPGCSAQIDYVNR